MRKRFFTHQGLFFWHQKSIKNNVCPKPFKGPSFVWFYVDFQKTKRKKASLGGPPSKFNGRPNGTPIQPSCALKLQQKRSPMLPRASLKPTRFQKVARRIQGSPFLCICMHHGTLLASFWKSLKRILQRIQRQYQAPSPLHPNVFTAWSGTLPQAT